MKLVKTIYLCKQNDISNCAGGLLKLSGMYIRRGLFPPSQCGKWEGGKHVYQICSFGMENLRWTLSFLDPKSIMENPAGTTRYKFHNIKTDVVLILIDYMTRVGATFVYVWNHDSQLVRFRHA